MTCKRDDGECVCVGSKSVMRLYCQYWREPERSRDAEDARQDANFERLTMDQQERCVAYLRVKVPNKVRAEWIDQGIRGVSIGSTDARFHFGVGMAVRNVLREVVPDANLPSGNWDDYYLGALMALVLNYPDLDPEPDIPDDPQDPPEDYAELD